MVVTRFLLWISTVIKLFPLNLNKTLVLNQANYLVKYFETIVLLSCIPQTLLAVDNQMPDKQKAELKEKYNS